MNTFIPIESSTWAVTLETMNALARFVSHGATEAQIEAARALRPAKKEAKAPGIAVIPLHGLITPEPSLLSMLLGGGAGLKQFRAELAEAMADPEVGQIVLDIDSPGGSVDLVPETAEAIRAARRSKPVTAVANTWAGSAAYWLAAQADELVVSPSGQVGSIGVFQVHEDYTGFNAKLGVTPTYVSAGKYKTELNPDAPLSDEAREHMQTQVDHYYGLFLADVAKGRGATPAQVRDGYGEGRMLNASAAVEAGMADRADSLERTVARLITEGREAAKRETRAEVPPPPMPESPPDPAVARLLVARPRH